jgi:hypothetical protein
MLGKYWETRPCCTSEGTIKRSKFSFTISYTKYGDGLVVADQTESLPGTPPRKIIGIGSLDILKRNGRTYGVFWPDTKISMDPNDLPLMKAYMEKCRWDGAIYQNYKKKPKVLL